MTLALSLFVLFYILMLAVQQYRPWVALGGAGAVSYTHLTLPTTSRV